MPPSSQPHLSCPPLRAGGQHVRSPRPPRAQDAQVQAACRGRRLLHAHQGTSNGNTGSRHTRMLKAGGWERGDQPAPLSFVLVHRRFCLPSPQRLTPLRQPLRSLSQKHRVPGHVQSLHRGPQQRPARARGHVQGLPPPRRREQVRHRLEEVGGQPATRGPRGVRVSRVRWPRPLQAAWAEHMYPPNRMYFLKKKNKLV